MKQLTFPRELRLLTPADFNQVFQNPQRVGTAYVTFVFRPNQCGYPRLGFAIAKKQLKRAHERNRIKRLVREYFRQQQHQLPAVDIIVMARTAAMTQSNQQLFQVIENLCLRMSKKMHSSPCRADV